MLRVAGVALGLLVAASTFLAVQGLAALFGKKWKAALAVLGGIGLLLAAVLLLTATAFLLGPANVVGDTIEPSQKARVLAENISALMNLSVLGFPLGVLAGLVSVFRHRATRS